MRKGFTLIELLVVIAVIGMLSSLVLVSMGGARKKARDARRMSDLRQIAAAMELAYIDSSSGCGGEDTYPTSSTKLTMICPGTGQYLNPFPADIPPNGYNWVNNTSACGGISAGQWYCVWVQLESEPNYTYFIASQRGTKKITTSTAPTNFNCNCGNL